MAESRECTTEDWCTTQTPIVALTFKWIIKNFNCHVRKVGYFLQSSTFSSEIDDKIKWYVKVYPKGEIKDNENNLSIFVRSTYKDDTPPTTVTIRCSILDSNKKPAKTIGIAPRSHDAFGKGLGWAKIIETANLQKLEALLPNDTLTLHFEITQMSESFNTARKIQISQLPECRLGDDLVDLLNKEAFSDVTLMAHGEKFRVHKYILAARSSVFAAMFMNEMKEKNQGLIDIVDMDNNVLRDLIHFIYSGKAPVNSNAKRTTELLAAADKYDLQRLKTMCEKDLCRKITTDNVADLLVLAYLHNTNELKARAMEFAYNPSHISTVVKLKSWSSVLNHPRLLTEMLEFCTQWGLKNTIL